jgi:hypothetical protein
MISRAALSTIVQGQPKYRSMLAGNTAFFPSSFESIATATPTSGSAITFSSIPSTYKHLHIRFSVKAPSGNPSLNLNYNGDTGSNYTIHTVTGNGSSVTAGASISRTNFPIAWNFGMVTVYQNVAIVDILDYASTTKYKTSRAFYGQESNSGSSASNLELNSGLWINTAAINSITVTVTGGLSYQSGTTISLYGIKG